MRSQVDNIPNLLAQVTEMGIPEEFEAIKGFIKKRMICLVIL